MYLMLYLYLYFCFATKASHSYLFFFFFTCRFWIPLCTVVNILILDSAFIYIFLLLSVFLFWGCSSEICLVTQPPTVSLSPEGLTPGKLFQTQAVFIMHKENCIGICQILGPLPAYEPRSR